MNLYEKSQQQDIYAQYIPSNQPQTYVNQSNQPTTQFQYQYNPQQYQQYQPIPQGYQNGMQQAQGFQQVVIIPHQQINLASLSEEKLRNQKKIWQILHWICLVLVLISIIINLVTYNSKSQSQGNKICMLISAIFWEIGMIIGVIGFQRQNPSQLIISSLIYLVSNILSFLALILENMSMVESKEFDQNMVIVTYFSTVFQLLVVYCFFGCTCQVRSLLLRKQVSSAPISSLPQQNQQVIQQESQGPFQNN